MQMSQLPRGVLASGANHSTDQHLQQPAANLGTVSADTIRASVNSTTVVHEDYSETYRYTGFRIIWNFISCKDLTLKKYRLLLFLTCIMNFACLTTELARIVIFSERVQTRDDDFKINKDREYILTFIVAIILTAINCLIIVKLLYRPTPKTALSSSAITIAIDIVSLVQICVYWNEIVPSPLNATATILFLILEFLSAILLYRYWEYAQFYYDDQADNPTNLLAEIITNYQEPKEGEEHFFPTSPSKSPKPSFSAAGSTNAVENPIDANPKVGSDRGRDLESGEEAAEEIRSPLQAPKDEHQQ